jgi:hypothetical protein
LPKTGWSAYVNLSNALNTYWNIWPVTPIGWPSPTLASNR